MLNDIFTYDGGNSVSFVVIGIFIGAAVACIVMLYIINFPGKMVRALVRLGALSPESAVSASDCGFKSEELLRFMLSEKGALSKYVHIIPVETVKKGKKEKTVLTSAKFYLEPETKDRAEIRYEKKRAGVLTAVVGILLLGILALAVIWLIPELMQMLKNFIGMFSTRE